MNAFPHLFSRPSASCWKHAFGMMREPGFGDRSRLLLLGPDIRFASSGMTVAAERHVNRLRET
jgi:hypothetical protein